MEKISFSMVALQTVLIGAIFSCTPVLEIFTSSPIFARKVSHILAPHVLLLYAYLTRHRVINPWEAVLPWAIIAGVLFVAVITSIIHERTRGSDRNALLHLLDKYMMRYKNSPLPALAYMVGMMCMSWAYKRNPIAALVGTMALAWGDGLSSLLTHNFKNVYLEFFTHAMITLTATFVSSCVVLVWCQRVLGIKLEQNNDESLLETVRMAILTALSEFMVSFIPILRHMDNLVIPIMAACNSPARRGFSWLRIKQSIEKFTK